MGSLVITYKSIIDRQSSSCQAVLYNVHITHIFL